MMGYFTVALLLCIFACVAGSYLDGRKSKETLSKILESLERSKR